MLRRGERNDPVAHEHCGDEDEQDAAGRGLGGPAAREQQQRQAAEADGDAGERPAVHALAADGRAHEHEPQRHRGDEQCGQPGGHVALGDGHEAVAAGRQQQADERRRRRGCGARRARGARARRGSASIATPAIAKRAPAPSSGGTSSTITRMAT